MNEFDINLLSAMNFDGGRVLDAIMWFCSSIPAWTPLYVAIAVIFYVRFGWKYALYAMLFISVGVAVCVLVCDLFKATIPYLRPTHDPDVAPLLHTLKGYAGERYGTVSGHASTSFTIFLLSSLMMRHRWFTAVMLCYAVLTTYSRIYLGVHYPMQILFGIVLGTVVALSLWKLFDTLDRRFGWKIERKT